MKRVTRQVRITLCGSGTRVTKKFAYQEKACTVGDCETRERMTQVMNSEVFELGCLADPFKHFPHAYSVPLAARSRKHEVAGIGLRA